MGGKQWARQVSRWVSSAWWWLKFWTWDYIKPVKRDAEED
jgi:hypothetical protein